MSGLSLRTIQRLEAGHRVSYSSLRALAATLQMDVDLLEQQLYAVKQSDEFVEIPRWVRLLNDGRLLGLPSFSRRQSLWSEACCMASGILFLGGSFLIPHGVPFGATALRVAAILNLVIGYALAVTIRVIDRYKAWPAAETSLSKWRPVRTFRSVAIEYAFVLVALIAFFAVVFSLSD